MVGTSEDGREGRRGVTAAGGSRLSDILPPPAVWLETTPVANCPGCSGVGGGGEKTSVAVLEFLAGTTERLAGSLAAA